VAAADCGLSPDLSEIGAPFEISDSRQRTARMAMTGVRAGLRWSGWLSRERVRAYAIIVLAVEGVALLIIAARTHDLILPINPPVAFDYVSFYAAGDLTDHGAAALAYDEEIHGQAEKRIYGDPRTPYFGFYYPPIFELLCAGLAALPFTASYVIFMVASGGGYFWVLCRTLRDPVLTIALAAFPAAFLTISLGQNSFLTTGLMGGALLVFDRRPLLAGVLLGAMSYKPHFLLLVPVALIAGRHWRALLAATATVAALASLSLLVLGSAPWHAWLTTTPQAQSVFATGRVGFYHLVNLYGAVRLIGGSTELAIGVQAMALIAAIAAVAIVWRGTRNPEIRGVTLVAATLGALPVVLFYDLLPATIAMAWLIRDARRHGYLPWEKMILSAMYPVALLCRGIGEKTNVPLGWLVAVGLLGLALAHVRRDVAR
jgi:alpha-1,2-mannosyltransferase